ncbi:unnamed protein product, partial [Durusdinium trenchii]
MASPASPAWSPGHLKLPRKMGRVDFSVREAAFAVGMSPAREPPGMHPMPENEQELRMVQAERSERVDPSASRRARDEARFSLEAKVAASVEARLQVVEEAVLELNQDLMAAASQLRQIQAEPRGFELEKALDQRVMDLEEDLTLVVTEVELRLRHLSGHLNQDVATDVFDWPRRRRAIEGAYGGVHVVGTQENRIGSWCSRVGAQSHRGEVEPPIEVKKTSIIPSQELEEIREWMRNFEVELKKRCFGTEALQQVRTEVTHQLETEVLADVRQRLSFLGNEVEETKRGIEDLQALKEVQQKASRTDEDAKDMAKNTRELHQVITGLRRQVLSEFDALKDTKRGAEEIQQELADVGHRTSSFDNELKETRKDVEDMQKALREVTEKTARTDEDARNIVKSTRELHQVITEVRQRLSCIDTELKDAKKGSENMQQALKELRESKNTADIKSVVSADLQQELADIGHRTSSFDNELKETRKDVEDMQKALREVTEKTARTDEDAKNIVKSTRELHQVITEVRQRLSCFDTELKDAKRGSENMQQALKELRESKNTADIKSVVSADLQQELADVGHRASSFDNELKETRKDVEDMQKALREVKQKTARTDEDARNIMKSTRELHQVITEVRQRLSCFDTELKDAKKGSENMQQELADVGHRASSFDNELRETRKEVDDIQKALKEVREKTARTDDDAKNIVKSTRELHQVITEVQQRLSCFDTELMDAKRGSEDMKQALREVEEQTARTDEDAKNIVKSTRELHQVITELRERLNCFDADMKDAREGSQHLGQVVAGVQQQTDGFLFELTGMKKSKEEMQEVFREAQGHAQRDLQVLKGSFETLQQALEDVSEMVTQREAETKSRERVTEELHQVVAEVQQQMGGLQSELTNMRKGTEDMQEVFRKAQEDAQRDLGVLRVSCEALQQALEDVSEKITQQEAETKSKDRGTESLHQVVAEVQQQVGSLQSELPNMRKGAEEMQEVFRKAQEDAERDLGVLRVSCEALQQALEDVSEKVAQKEEAESSERGMEALHQVVSCFQSELTSMRNGTEDMQAKLGASEGDLRELWNACQQCQEVSTASQQEIQALKEKLVELQAGHGERTLPQLMEREEELLQSHSELQAEVKVLTLEARQSRHQGIKSQAELGQALASIEENRTSNARSFEDFEAKLHSVAQRAEECEAWQSNSRPEELWECCAQLLRSCELELTEERGQRAEEVAAVTTGLREQQDQGLKLQEHLWQLQEGPLESLALMAEEWRAGLCELRVALEDTAQEESLVELRSAVTLEMAEARSFVSESLAEQAERFSEELLQDSRRKGLELEGVRRQLLETVEDRIALRRQLLDMCRDRSAPRHGAPKRVAAERASEVEPGQQEG